ncbi:hypothetical protein D3C87_1427660 [compost metagenome]
MPCTDLCHDLVGYRADEVRRNVRTVLLGKKRTDLSDRHSTGIHGDDLVVEAGVTALVLRNQDGRKTAVPVARDIQSKRAIAG